MEIHETELFKKIESYLRDKKFAKESNSINIQSKDKHWDSSLLTNQIYKIVEEKGIGAEIKVKEGSVFIDITIQNVNIDLTIEIAVTLAIYWYFRRKLREEKRRHPPYSDISMKVNQTNINIKEINYYIHSEEKKEKIK